MRFSCFVLSLVFLVVFSQSTVSANRDHDCFVGHRYYRHSQLFSLPNQSQCIKYICWYGRVIRRIEACEVEGECHRVGSTFDHKCTRYRCNKIDRGHAMYYQPEIISTQCRDFNGQCRRPGESFPFQMHGTYYPSCTCTTSSNSIRYRCVSYQLPTGRRVTSGRQGNAAFQGRQHPDEHLGYALVGGPEAGEDSSEVSISVNPLRVEK